MILSDDDLRKETDAIFSSTIVQVHNEGTPAGNNISSDSISSVGSDCSAESASPTKSINTWLDGD